MASAPSSSLFLISSPISTAPSARARVRAAQPCPSPCRPSLRPRRTSQVVAAAVQAEHQPAVAAAPKPPALPFRVGHGFDLHRLEPDLPLIIGGINIPHDRGCDAHSDGTCRPRLPFSIDACSSSTVPFHSSRRLPDRVCGDSRSCFRRRAAALRGGRDSRRSGSAGHWSDLPGLGPPLEGRRFFSVHEGSGEFAIVLSS
jgi:hypothetical protein